MKNLLAISVLLLLSLNLHASVAFTVEGELQENLGDDKDLVQFILLSEGKKVKVTNVDHNITECRSGLFEIVNNFYPEDTYSLLEVHACYEEIKGDAKVCPEIYRPVCGLAQQTECSNDFCIQMLPAPSTYENYCVLHNANASFINMGECEDN